MNEIIVVIRHLLVLWVQSLMNLWHHSDSHLPSAINSHISETIEDLFLLIWHRHILGHCCCAGHIFLFGHRAQVW